jgi:hypothetical protein
MNQRYMKQDQASKKYLKNIIQNLNRQQLEEYLTDGTQNYKVIKLKLKTCNYLSSF